MGFKSKVDKFGLADNSTLVLVSTEEGLSSSVAEAMGEDGSIVASEVYGETSAPSCEYVVKANLASTTAKDVVLGGVTSVGEGAAAKHYCLTSLEISTSAGSPPSVSASGEQVPSGTPSCTYTVEDGISVNAKNHAQILQSAFTLTGTGCHVTECTASYSCSLGAATKDGEKIAWDVGEGKIEVSATINQTGSTTPTVTVTSPWVITSPLTESNPDSDFPTYAVTVTKYLAKDAG